MWLDCSSLNLDDWQTSRILETFLSSGNVNRLRLLNLKNNQLTHVPNQIRLFSHLTRLNLGRNKIRSIKSEDFNFSKVSTDDGGIQLWLNDNYLRHIEPCALLGYYGKSSVLVLGDNALNRFESDVFQSILYQMEPHQDTSIRIDDSE